MSGKKINENPEMTGINKLKNLGKQQDASLGGIQPQLLAKAMQQASQGKSVSGAYSQQLGLLLNVLNPIMNDSSALQRVLQISGQVKDKQPGVTGGAVAKGDGKIPAGSIVGNTTMAQARGGAVAKGDGKIPKGSILGSAPKESKEVTEMDQTDLQRIKSLAGVDNKEIAGMNLPLLMKGLEQAQQGQQMSPQQSSQVGVLLQLIEPIAKAGNLQQLITLSKRSEKQPTPVQRNAEQDPDSDYRAGRMDNVDLEDSVDFDIEQLDLSEEVGMGILNQYLEPDEANLVKQAKARMAAGEGVPSNMVGALSKYMKVVDDFLEMGSAGLTRLKTAHKSATGQELGKEEEPKDDESMNMVEPEDNGKDDDKKEESINLDELRELAGLQEGLGYADPGEDSERVTYSKTKKQGDASVTVSANADSMGELHDILKLAGIDFDGQGDAVPGDAEDEDPEKEDVLLKPEHDHDDHEHDAEPCANCGEMDCDCDDGCGHDNDGEKPKMIVVSPAMDKNAIFNSLKAKLQDKLSS